MSFSKRFPEKKRGIYVMMFKAEPLLKNGQKTLNTPRPCPFFRKKMAPLLRMPRSIVVDPAGNGTWVAYGYLCTKTTEMLVLDTDD